MAIGMVMETLPTCFPGELCPTATVVGVAFQCTLANLSGVYKVWELGALADGAALTCVTGR